MKFVQLDKPSWIGIPTRGRSKGIKLHKKMRNRFIRRTPMDDKPMTNRYSGWWY